MSRAYAKRASCPGRAAMTEYASRPGLNPHYGTPPIPSGGSDGASRGIVGGRGGLVADGMACAPSHGHGRFVPDTRGVLRAVGFKPIRPRAYGGVYPCHHLDCVGSLGWTVSCCAILDTVMVRRAPVELPSDPGGSQAGGPGRLCRAGMNTEVGAVYDAALERLSRSGVTIEAVEWPELDEIRG